MNLSQIFSRRGRRPATPVMAAVVTGLMIAPAVAQADPLTGEVLHTTNVLESPVGTCAGSASTLSFIAQGTATGPYPGPFTETGTATVPSGPVVGTTSGFTAHFVINSPAGQVTGDKQFVTGGPGDCFGPVFEAIAATTYTATTPNGPDSGTSNVGFVAGTQLTPGSSFNEDLQSTAISTDNDLALQGLPAPITTNATGPNGASVTYTPPSASDEDGETPAVICTPASGSTFPVGTTTVTCTASDPDDSNSPATGSFNVTVNGGAQQLSDLQAAVQGVGPGTSLSDKVAQAQAQLGSGATADACGTLRAFMQEIGAQAGKHIASAVAVELIADAQRIEAVIGC